MSDDKVQTGVQGQRIGGRFELVEKLGSGGYGSVWRCRDRRAASEANEYVALKLVRAHRRGDELVLARFEREAQALQRLIHPNTVRLIAFGPCEEGYYLALELLDGETLGDRLVRQTLLDAAHVHAVGMSVLHALSEAHTLGIVHRDIKPDNIFLCADGRTKVLDWGLVKALEETLIHKAAPTVMPGVMPDPEPVTQQGMVVGSLAYMAPERIGGQGASPAGDIYSLGCTLYAALTGGPPYTAGIGKAVLAQAHQHALVPRPVVDGVALAGPLVQHITAMMAKEPSERPTTIHSLVKMAGLRPPLVYDAPADASAEPSSQADAGTVMLPTLSPADSTGPTGPTGEHRRRAENATVMLD